MDKPVSPFIFTNYDKISDNLMWFGSSKYRLRFNVQLNRRDNAGNIKSFHNEFSFYNESMDKNCINIIRDYKYFYSIDKASGSLDESVILRQNDVEVLRYIIKERIYPWIFGSKSVYGFDKNKNLCLKQNVKAILIPLSNQNFISFKPIIVHYENTHESKEGIQIVINNEDNAIEIDIDTFFQFSSIILNTDMVNAAMNMLTYVKVKPYLINNNLNQTGDSGQLNYGRKRGKGFFDN